MASRITETGGSPRHYVSEDHNENAAESTPLQAWNHEPPPPSRKQLTKRLLSILDRTPESHHKVRPVFTELEELTLSEWRETARWIKFEENVEDGGNRWSKPHVASLALRQLFELKKLLKSGTIWLDLDANSLEQIVNSVADRLVADGFLPGPKADKFKSVLLKRHRHQHQRKNSILQKGQKGNGRKLQDHENGINTKDISLTRKRADDLISDKAAIRVVKTPPPDEENDDDNPNSKPNKDFMRKIPPGAEASSVLAAEVDFLDRPICVFIRLKTATLLENFVEVPIANRFIFLLILAGRNNDEPAGAADLSAPEIARSMGVLMSDEIFQEVAYKSKTPTHILVGLEEFLNNVTVLPPGEWDPAIRIEPPNAVPSQELRRRFLQDASVSEELDEEEQEQRNREMSGLARSGILFGGLMNDVKRKAPFYWSDFRDSLSMQCVASWIFLYFACLSPIITFGGLLAHATGNHMAAMESLVSGFVCGIGYGLFAGQPLSILGSTGPVLVFEKIVYNLCISNDWNYLSLRFWIGTWTAVTLVILVATDASAYVCYITRFTEENFALLIAVIYVVEAMQNVAHIGNQFPMHMKLAENCSCNSGEGNYVTVSNLLERDQCLIANGTIAGIDCGNLEYVPNVFLMSVILCAGTFLISWYLKKFKNALFFSSTVRQYISDFAVLIAIVSMSLLDYGTGVATPKLEVPSELKPTLPTRQWLIYPFNGNPFHTVFIAIPPALLGTILIFMDQQITTVIVNREEHKLKKKCGYHLDLFVLAILIQVCSVLGIPWFVAATVLSINHVNSLKKESECSAPGEKPQFLGVREQRVTNVFIFLTIGLSVFLTPVLRHVPMPVLFGVFLYMGLASLDGLQFWNRILLIFMPKKYQPDFQFLRRVPIGRVHLYTVIQLVCLASLWIVKSFSSTSILFPMMLVVMVGVRKMLDFVFTQKELKSLDNALPNKSRRHVAALPKLNQTWPAKVSTFILGPRLPLDFGTKTRNNHEIC